MNQNNNNDKRNGGGEQNPSNPNEPKKEWGDKPKEEPKQSDGK